MEHPRKTKKFIQSIFDEMNITIMTRCIAELCIAEGKHPAYRHHLN